MTPGSTVDCEPDTDGQQPVKSCASLAVLHVCACQMVVQVSHRATP
jgi:hypothetical protein